MYKQIISILPQDPGIHNYNNRDQHHTPVKHKTTKITTTVRNIDTATKLASTQTRTTERYPMDAAL